MPICFHCNNFYQAGSKHECDENTPKRVVPVPPSDISTKEMLKKLYRGPFDLEHRIEQDISNIKSAINHIQRMSSDFECMDAARMRRLKSMESDMLALLGNIKSDMIIEHGQITDGEA